MEELIYWRHPTPPGIKVEEISGGSAPTAKIWLEMARQIYCENGKESYREIGHLHNGAPFLHGESYRISVTHCDGLLAVASLPPTPEADLTTFSQRACLGIDAERADRSQVLKIRERFLGAEELSEIPAEDVEANILAWTVKEAVYKAALTDGLDLRDNIRIDRLPILGPATPVFNPKEFGLPEDCTVVPENFYGSATVAMPAEEGISFDERTDAEVTLLNTFVEMRLYSYKSDDCIVTLAYSPRSAKFGKNSR